MEDYKVCMRFDFGNYLIEKLSVKNGRPIELQVFEDVNDAINTLKKLTLEIENIDVLSK